MSLLSLVLIHFLVKITRLGIQCMVYVDADGFLGLYRDSQSWVG